MAPTTLPGMKATTAQNGRDPKVNGNPLRVSEMLASLTGPAYIERVSISTPAQVAAAKKATEKALNPETGSGLHLHRGCSFLPYKLGSDTRKSYGICKRKNDSLLSSGRI